jgi:hypothetical protein
LRGKNDPVYGRIAAVRGPLRVSVAAGRRSTHRQMSDPLRDPAIRDAIFEHEMFAACDLNGL